MGSNRYLFIRLSALGDVIFALEALAALKRAEPGSRVDWLVEDRAAALLEGHPLIDRVLIYPRRKIARSLARPWLWPSAVRSILVHGRALRRERYTAALDLHGNLKSGLHLLFCRAARKLGFDKPHAREGSQRMATERVRVGDGSVHRAEQGMRLVAQLLGSEPERGNFVLLPRRGDEAARARDLLARHPVTGTGAFVGLAPGASDFAAFKRWPAASFRNLAASLAQQGLRVVLCTGPGEQALANEVSAENPDLLWVDGEESGLACYIEVLRQLDVVVAADSGPLHMAQAVGTPAVALFGPKDPAVYGPRLPQSVVLRYPVPCAPCGRRSCAAPICVLGIPVEAVMAAVHAILNGASATTASEQTQRTLVLRHYKERKSKCSLQPLVDRSDIAFVEWEPEASLELGPHLLLELDAPELSREDAGLPLLLLDSTWRYLAPMRASVTGPIIPRALPKSLQTAYPRKSKLNNDPGAGLASIEALYAALRILGRRDDSLLSDYHWREEFLGYCDEAGI